MKFKSSIEIEGRKIGPGEPSFIIAEIGVNHNGDMELAKGMIDSAIASGADCVKFQSFRAEEFMADKNLEYEYEVRGKKVREKMFEMFKRLELSESGHAELFSYARSKGALPLTSVADPESAELVRQIGIGALKLASEDLINLPLVNYVAQLDLPLIFSTGMADREEVEDVLRILEKHKKKDVIFLHCVSVYPTADREVNIDRMLALGELTKAPIGYSDHSLGIEACMAAVALGACVIEKHFTTDRHLDGPDHLLSSDPEEFSRLVKGIRRFESFRGQREIEPSETERRTKLDFRRSIVAAKELPAGHKLQEGDLALKRPGTGLRARDLPKIYGKKLKRPLKANDQLKLEDIGK